MKALSIVQRAATGKVVLAFVIPTITVYFTMLLVTIPQVSAYAPGMNLFDLSPTGYSFEYAMKLLDALGSEGRDLYLYRQLPLDFIFPGLFAVSCCLLLSWIFLKTHETNSTVFYFCFIPVAAGLFDYLENISIVNMLTAYPDVSEASVSIASAMTVVKSALVTAFFVVLITAAISNLRKRGRSNP